MDHWGGNLNRHGLRQEDGRIRRWEGGKLRGEEDAKIGYTETDFTGNLIILEPGRKPG